MLRESPARVPAEDVNLDGSWDALDCQGPAGPKGPAGAKGADGKNGNDGINCWDLNGNGKKDAAEDINKDGVWDAQDCKGPKGDKGDPLDPAKRVNIISFDSTGSVHNRPETYIDPDVGDSTIISGGLIDLTMIRIIPKGGNTPTAVIAPDGEGYFRSLHVVDSLGNPLISFERDGYSYHSMPEFYFGGIEIPLENGNILRLDPLEGLTIKTPSGGWVSHIDPQGNFLFVGQKNNIVLTENYGTRKLYAMESPEIRYADYGQGRLIGGTSNASFDWQIVVKRKGYEDVRMESYERATTQEEIEKQSRQAPTPNEDRFRTKAPWFDSGNQGQR